MVVMPWPKRPANSAGWKTCWAALSATLSVKSGRLRGGEEGGVGGRPHDIDTEYNNRSSDKISRDKLAIEIVIKKKNTKKT